LRRVKERIRRKRNTISIQDWVSDRGELGAVYYCDIDGRKVRVSTIDEINWKKVTWNPDPYATWGRGDSMLEAFYGGRIPIE